MPAVVTKGEPNKLLKASELVQSRLYEITNSDCPDYVGHLAVRVGDNVYRIENEDATTCWLPRFDSVERCKKIGYREVNNGATITINRRSS